MRRIPIYLYHYAIGGESGDRNHAEARHYSLSETCGPALEPTQTPIKWIRGSFPGVKRPGREVHHSFPSSVKVKNKWIYTISPPQKKIPSRRALGQLYRFGSVRKISKSDYWLRHVCPSAGGNLAAT